MSGIDGLVGYFLALVLALCLSGCSTFFQNADEVLWREHDGNIYTQRYVKVEDRARMETNPEFFDLHEYAIFSSNVYHDDLNSPETNDIYDPNLTIEQACERVMADDKEMKLLPVPPHWEKISEKDIIAMPEKPENSYKTPGFGYNVWIKNKESAAPTVLIVFRGTDFDKFWDWYSNIRWVTRFIPWVWDQYDQVRDFIPKLTADIIEHYGEGKNIRFVAAGHSLGGGLAQQAAYASSNVNKVYAFDPSMVTGYYSVRPVSRRNENKAGVQTVRAYEHGEVLAYLRWFFRQLYTISAENPKIVEVRYNYQKGSIFAQHSIIKLACNLTKSYKEAN